MQRLFAVLLASCFVFVGCTSRTSSSPGGGGPAGGGGGGGAAVNCQERCAAFAGACGLPTTQCAAQCEGLSESQISCVENSGCEASEVQACLQGGSGGTEPDAGAAQQTLAAEGAACACRESGAISCSSTSGPCEADLTCFQDICLDREKTCERPADCGTGYECTVFYQNNTKVSIGSFCVKQ